MATPISIAFLGGLGEIGRNCMVLEQEDRLLLIDCGLMFPDADMHGIDLVLPDFTYLRDNADRIVGCVATHGHEDHVGALSFLLRELSFPIYGSALTLGLARNRIEEAGLLDRTRLEVVGDGERRRIGPFDVEFIPVTHSVPHAFAIAVHTAQGVVLHSGDFKLDLTPVDGRRTDLARIGAIAESEGIRLLLSDSTNARGARVRAERAQGGRGAARPLRRPARPTHHHLQLRQPHPPHPADRRRRHRQRAGGGHLGHVDQEERAAGPRPRPAVHPGRVADRHRGGGPPRARARCASSPPARRANRCPRSG